jgi:chemotaxis family two-component system sensor kinase Cph1
VSLFVEDDGIGFDSQLEPDARDQPLGLLGMRERASILGGTLEVESHLDRGTIVFARIPALVRPAVTKPH